VIGPITGWLRVAFRGAKDDNENSQMTRWPGHLQAPRPLSVLFNPPDTRLLRVLSRLVGALPDFDWSRSLGGMIVIAVA